MSPQDIAKALNMTADVDRATAIALDFNRAIRERGKMVAADFVVALATIVAFLAAGEQKPPCEPDELIDALAIIAKEIAKEVAADRQ